MFITVPHERQWNKSSLDNVLSCQPRVTVTSYFVYKVIRDLELIDHLCINPIRRIGADRINTQMIYRFAPAQVACTS